MLVLCCSYSRIHSNYFFDSLPTPDLEAIVAHANRIRARFAAGDLLDRETIKNLLSTVILTGSAHPEPCVVALTSLLRRCGFTKFEINTIKGNMELEERILDNKNNATSGDSIFGWFGAAPPSPPPMVLPDYTAPTRDEMLNESMMREFDGVQGGERETKGEETKSIELDLS